jgi:hypothetical protein
MTALLRGLVAARAVVLDVDLIGFDEATRRVLDAWMPGSELRSLAPGRWLMIFSEAREVRIEAAPGSSLVDDQEGLTAPGLPGLPGKVTYWSAGAVRQHDLSSLSLVPLGTWFDLSDHPIRRLAPIQAPDSPAVPPVERVRPNPDLRAAAGLRPSDGTRLARLTTKGPSIRWGLIAALLGVIATVVIGLVWLVGGDDQSSAPATSSPARQSTVKVTLPPQPGAPSGVTTTIAAPTTRNPDTGPDFDARSVPVILGLIIGLRVLSGRGKHEKGSQTRGVRSVRKRGWFARLVMRSPAQGFVHRRHLRYVRSLTVKFERRQWQDALSDAIALGGTAGAGWLRLRLPRRRESLAFTTAGASGGSVIFGDSAYLYLRGLYLDAAKQLDESGRVDEAAFVYAELLHDASAAVTVLERNDRLRSAAELAEARGLAAELQVRLWWRAGDRQRAVGIARARGAFATAVERLTPIDADAARALREEWVRASQAAGDHFGAVSAGWPDPALRPLVIPDIEAGIAIGGPTSGELFAHLVTERPSEDTSERAIALLETRLPELRRVRDGFIGALARLTAVDPVQDRRVSTAAVRTLIEQEPSRQLHEQLRVLSRRADPLVTADLPRISNSNRRDLYRYRSCRSRRGRTAPGVRLCRVDWACASRRTWRHGCPTDNTRRSGTRPLGRTDPQTRRCRQRFERVAGA